MQQKSQLTIVGGGLAGCEAAWQAACAGMPVTLVEMRPLERSAAHQTDQLAELVCSNSLRSDDPAYSAIGLLHEEMRRAGSLILSAADKHRVPAGSALAVDREGFSQEIENRLQDLPNVRLERRRVDALPSADDGPTIIATGPLTASSLAEDIRALTGQDSLAFFDAIAPVIYGDSIDFSRAWRQSRYDKGEGADYINCPLDKAQYETFIDDLLAAETIQFREWEAITPYFDGCLPIEVMAARGLDTLRYGPMKPVGLTNPHSPDKPHAVVQLRQDNALGTLFNIVGFQTKMSYSAQKQVFTKIPGLEGARFARLGGIHRNTFINSPKLLDHSLRLKKRPNIRFAGQMTGVEGYVESAAMGLLAGRFAAAEFLHQALAAPPATTALGALLAHITGGHLAEGDSFQPMNINFGLLPDLQKRVRGRERKAAYSARALGDLDDWLATLPAAA